MSKRPNRARSIAAFSLLGIGVLAAANVAVAQKNKSGPNLPKSTTSKLDAAIPLLKAGKIADAAKIISPLIRTADDNEIDRFDDYLAQKSVKHKVLDICTEGRIQAVLAGQTKLTGKIGTRELSAALVALAKRADDPVRFAREDLKIGVRANIPHELLDQLIERLPSASESIDQSDALLAHLEQLTKGLKAAEKDKLSADAAGVVDRDFAAERTRLAELKDQVLEQLCELCLVQIDGMMTVFSGENADFARRMKAGERLGDSFAVLFENWDAYKKRKHRAPGAANPGDVEKKWRDQHERFIAAAPAFRQKIYHFGRAKEWWLRGRFGIGDLGGGLAKSIPPGTRNLVTFLTFFPLMMPADMKKPPDPVATPLSWFPERRFAEWWKAEIRLTPTQEQISGYSPQRVNRFLVKAILGKIDNEPIPNTIEMDCDYLNLVGYLEYQMALYHFETLLSLCTPAEVRALDDMIGNDDRFVVYSHLSRIYDQLDPNSRLKLSPPAEQDARSKNLYERRGLGWVMALARVEASAMLAPEWRLKRGNKSSGSGPFEMWPVTELEAEPFREIISDGARQMFYSARTEMGDLRFAVSVTGDAGRDYIESGARILVGQNPNVTGPALLLRLTVAIELINAFHELENITTGPRLAELTQWMEWTERNRLSIARMLRVDVPGLPTAAAGSFLGDNNIEIRVSRNPAPGKQPSAPAPVPAPRSGSPAPVPPNSQPKAVPDDTPPASSGGIPAPPVVPMPPGRSEKPGKKF